MAPNIHSPARSVQRHRFETRRRDLTVTGREQMTPHMLRLTLSGDLSGFQSLGFDDHVKLFFPDPVTGSYEPADGAKPLARDYTPRRFDVAAGTLVLDFALHGVAGGQAGPATAWAGKAVIGDRLVIGGPRGSSVLPLDFGLHLLIGDDTALPAIGRRLEELPAGARALVLAEVESPADCLTLDSRAEFTIHWLFRDPAHGGRDLLSAVAGLRLPDPDVLAWVAGEALQTRRVRDELLTRHGLDPQWVKASGYWQQGEAGAHTRIE